MKLKEIKTIKGKIILRTGLHIGSGNMEMQIGGTDNPVIKHPHTQEPYIPGSSLKGKIRSLLEYYYGVVAESAKTEDYKKSGGLASCELYRRANGDVKKHIKNILKVFGSAASDEELLVEFGPTRVSFSDCSLSEDFKKEAEEKQWSYIEVKSENRINRITGTAKDPRFIERVPAGAKFDFEVYFKILDDEDEELFENYLLTGLKLLEMDSLGGSGSRGYGKIEFQFYDKQIREKFNSLKLWG
ncbi:type III-A CRISPR-associated RAMP protein Csm3 [Thermodesulfovibrio sp. 3907-1M]|uniref:CRISPR system Cms endoribonuclease Csm3 n=1 Tax=Thermodesulfovibrio autotrophicus TaxID=3118333 RepID=A0AAU8GVB2_9BACT